MWLSAALMLECFVTYSYYANYNKTGQSCKARVERHLGVLMLMLARVIEVLFLAVSSFRSTVSLFLILIVAMGYGIHK